MSIEAATYISQLDPAKPNENDLKSEGDDVLRLLKAVLQANFPNLTAAAVNATTAELNALVGRAADIAAIANAGSTGATALKVATKTPGTNTTDASSTAFVSAAVAAAALSTVLPSQSGNGGKFVTTDGTNASWSYTRLPWVRKTSAYAAISGDRIKASTTGGAWSLTFPAAPLDGDAIEVQDVDGTFATNALTLLANGKKIMGFTTSLVLDKANIHLVFVYDATNGDWRY